MRLGSGLGRPELCWHVSGEKVRVGRVRVEECRRVGECCGGEQGEGVQVGG